VEVPPDDAKVGFPDQPVLELAGETLSRDEGLGKDENAARLPIEAMNDPQPPVRSIPSQYVKDRVQEVASRGMNGDVARFAHGEKGIVFVDDGTVGVHGRLRQGRGAIFDDVPGL
jgi:hypothetical protein